MLRQISQAKCLPVSLAQARKHLAVDSSDRSNDSLITLLIEAATADSQMKTGRVWVESDWEWKIDAPEVNSKEAFPIVPVVCVKLYDLDEEFPEEPEEPENPDSGDGDEDDEWGPGNTRAATQSLKKRDADDEEKPEFTNVADEYFAIEYPSPDPLGTPAIGSVTPLKSLPKNYRLVLTVGYPTTQTEEVVTQYTNPVLVPEKTAYADGVVRLVFDRPVQGDININNFEFRVNGLVITLEQAYFKDGCVELRWGDNQEGMAPGVGDMASVSFFEGAIYDEFQNFVQPIIQAQLPVISYMPESYFPTAEPIPTEYVYESDAPSPIKNWILTRVGTLYSQRTEIAQRAGKSNDAMFEDAFINNLLDPYRVRFLG